MLATWLSFEDLTALVKCVFEVDRLGFADIYGVSDNKEKWWDNRLSAHVGWTPKDSSEQFENDDDFVDEIVDPLDPATKFQVGAFASAGHFEDK